MPELLDYERRMQLMDHYKELANVGGRSITAGICEDLASRLQRALDYVDTLNLAEDAGGNLFLSDLSEVMFDLGVSLETAESETWDYINMISENGEPLDDNSLGAVDSAFAAFNEIFRHARGNAEHARRGIVDMLRNLRELAGALAMYEDCIFYRGRKFVDNVL